MDETSSRQQTPVMHTSSELRLLNARHISFSQNGSSLRMTLAGECSYLNVTTLRAFPLSEPQRYVSVRDAQGGEIGVIVEPAALDAASRRAVEQALERRYVVPSIRRILAARERFGAVEWTAETDRGLVRFTTRDLREHTTHVSHNRYLITDVDGNRYDVRDLQALDAASRRWLMRYL